MRRRRALLGGAIALCLTLTGFPGASPAIGNGAPAAGWGHPFAEDPAFGDGEGEGHAPETIEESKRTPPAVSVAVLPDGRILYWGGLEGLEDSAAPLALDAGRSATLSRARVLDLRDGTPSWSTPTPEFGGETDMFCADQRLLHDGRLLVAGGTIYRNDPVDLTPVTGPEGPGGTAELFGSNETRLFDPEVGEHGTFSPADEMNHGRWYPTLVTLPDGRVFVASGVERLLYNDKGLNVHATEIFDPETGAWTDNGSDGETSLPLFARMHLLPDGKVFYGGVGQMWSPFGQAVDEALWHLHKTYDPAENSWEIAGLGGHGARSGAFSVMLPLAPPYDEARILVGGGTLGTSPGSYVSNSLTEIVTVNDGMSSVERGPDLNNDRWYSSGVLLPDGGVVAVNGATADEVIAPGTEFPVRQAELFDGESWVPLGEGSRDRTYHNAAVLLADGRVLVTGHSPINTLYGPTGDNGLRDAIGTANNFKDPSFEILTPPYLSNGDRPVIELAQKGIAWTESSAAAFPLTVDDADAIERVVLMRLPSTTHVTDADMRAVELAYEQTGQKTLDVTGPPNGNVAPPGYYYLFVLNDAGTPSKARVVKVGSTPDVGQADAPMGL